MALPSSFQERLRQMEETRNQRLSLLQAEKELQSRKSLLLSAKLSNLRRLEQRCLVLEQKNAFLNFQILAKKSEIETVSGEYQRAAQQIRDLKIEIGEFDEREKEREKFYEAKSSDMEEFRDEVARCVTESHLDVQKLRNDVNELKLKLKELRGCDGYLNNSEIAAAEARKSELLTQKENLHRSLASNYQLRSLLQKQLQKILMSNDQESKNGSESVKERSEIANMQNRGKATHNQQ